MIDVGQSYPQRVVKAGVAALGHAQGADGSHHLAYEKVVLSPATARALGYEVSEDDASVKVSGRKGLGVKADDLVDALVAKARAEVDARDPERDAAAREATAQAVATGALRYFMLKFSRTRIITFDMEEALAFTGETGPYLQNAVVRARNIFGKLEAEGHDVDGARSRGPARSTSRAFLTGEEGDEVWSLLLLMARSEEVAEQAIRGRGRGARRQARLRRGAGVPLLLPEAPATRCCTRRARTCAPAARSWSTRSCGRWRSCWACSASPCPTACDAAASSASRSATATSRACTRCARTTSARWSRPGAVPVVLPPLSPQDARPLLDRLDGLLLSGGGDVDPALYGAAPHPKLGTRRPASATTSSSRSCARRCGATCRSSLSAGDSRC